MCDLAKFQTHWLVDNILEKEAVLCTEWPACSSLLNLIEHSLETFRRSRSTRPPSSFLLSGFWIFHILSGTECLKLQRQSHRIYGKCMRNLSTLNCLRYNAFIHQSGNIRTRGILKFKFCQKYGNQLFRTWRYLASTSLIRRIRQFNKR